MIELIKWCFQDGASSFCTIIVIVVIFGGVVEIIKALKK
jgi:hypothetical protein